MPSQQAPPVQDTSSVPAFPNHPFNQSTQLPSTNFGPSQTETHSSDWSWENAQNVEGTLYSMFNTRKSSSSKSASKGQSSNFTSGNPDSSTSASLSHYGGAMPYQQALLAGGRQCR
uniref:Ovule protein n=1 Tax=Globodera pallida TaxID=36090 RepID=A0A183BUH1_GLOPA